MRYKVIVNVDIEATIDFDPEKIDEYTYNDDVEGQIFDELTQDINWEVEFDSINCTDNEAECMDVKTVKELKRID